MFNDLSVDTSIMYTYNFIVFGYDVGQLAVHEKVFVNFSHLIVLFLQTFLYNFMEQREHLFDFRCLLDMIKGADKVVSVPVDTEINFAI